MNLIGEFTITLFIYIDISDIHLYSTMHLGYNSSSTSFFFAVGYIPDGNP